MSARASCPTVTMAMGCQDTMGSSSSNQNISSTTISTATENPTWYRDKQYIRSLCTKVIPYQLWGNASQSVCFAFPHIVIAR